MQKADTSKYESPRLTTYGDLKTVTKGQLITSGDTTAGFKP